MDNNSNNLILKYIKFINNNAEDFATGIYSDSSKNITFSDLYFENNTALNHGGAGFFCDEV